MPRQARTMSVRTAETIRKPGLHPAGGVVGLHLRVKPGGSKSWVYRYTRAGRTRGMGLGSLADVTLAEARERAYAARRLYLAGQDPIDARRAERGQDAVGRARTITFEAAAERYIEAHQAGWKSPKHGFQFRSSLALYAFPVFGKLPVAAIDTGLIVRALDAIWRTKPETATRVRQRVESVLDFAAVHGYRPKGDNPARWRGHLDHILPDPERVRRRQHHAALAYGEVSGFLAALRGIDTMPAKALEFAIYTAARIGEVCGARWSEINLAERLWIIPAERMKSGREHRVPLSAPALALLDSLPRAGDYIFASGRRGDAGLSPMAPPMLLRRLDRRDITVHGFRSTFADWAAERTAFPAEVREMALAHTVGSKVEQAYRRTDLFEKRRALAEQWAAFCSMPAGDGAAVVPIRRG